MRALYTVLGLKLLFGTKPGLAIVAFFGLLVTGVAVANKSVGVLAIAIFFISVLSLRKLLRNDH